jgi:thymidylate synthase ThyX
MFEDMGAELIWDGDDSADGVKIPERMGAPREGQMVGTTAERLTEICDRVCYDSMGSKRSRDSGEYIKHILDVGHTSIAEHYNATLLIEGKDQSFIDMLSFVMLNRPWIWVTPLSPTSARLTMNCRVAMEFDRWTKILSESMPDYPIAEAAHLSVIIKDCWHDLAPRLVTEPHPAAKSMAIEQLGVSMSVIVEPETDAEKWISIYTYGSRGYSHEAVRHGDFSAFSQRSTRYVNEGSGPWSIHPLIQLYLKEADPVESMISGEGLKTFISDARDLYKSWVKKLIPYAKSKIDPSDPYAKTTARKQARGAARGLLGNALETELIFSATVMQWRHIFEMRASAAADAEIRFVACEALKVCKSSRYGDRFEDMQLVPADDGTGLMLAGGGAS